MNNQNWSKDILLTENSTLAENSINVALPPEPKTADELSTIIEIVRNRINCDVSIDFSRVDTLTSLTLAKLLKLRKLLTNSGHNLVLYKVSAATRGIFKVTGSDEFFEFVDDESLMENRDIRGDELPPLKTEEEHLLFKSVIERNDQSARELLSRNNLRLVVNIAKKYVGRGIDLGDLIEEGNLALLKAIDRFGSEKGIRFSHYAAQSITRSIEKLVLKQERAKKFSKGLTDEEFEFIMAVDEYKRQHTKPFPTWGEVLHVIKDLGYQKASQSPVYASTQRNKSGNVNTVISLSDDITYEEVSRLLRALYSLHLQIAGRPPCLNFISIKQWKKKSAAIVEDTQNEK